MRTALLVLLLASAAHAVPLLGRYCRPACWKRDASPQDGVSPASEMASPEDPAVDPAWYPAAPPPPPAMYDGDVTDPSTTTDVKDPAYPAVDGAPTWPDAGEGEVKPVDPSVGDASGTQPTYEGEPTDTGEVKPADPAVDGYGAGGMEVYNPTGTGEVKPADPTVDGSDAGTQPTYEGGDKPTDPTYQGGDKPTNPTSEGGEKPVDPPADLTVEVSPATDMQPTDQGKGKPTDPTVDGSPASGVSTDQGGKPVDTWPAGGDVKPDGNSSPVGDWQSSPIGDGQSDSTPKPTDAYTEPKPVDTTSNDAPEIPRAPLDPSPTGGTPPSPSDQSTAMNGLMNAINDILGAMGSSGNAAGAGGDGQSSDQTADSIKNAITNGDGADASPPGPSSQAAQ